MSELLRETRSSCPYCGTGCGLIVQSRGESIVAVRGAPDHPANRGKLCPKGASLAQTASPAVLAGARQLHPLARPSREQAQEAMGWQPALELAADRFAQAIREHGPDSVAFYVSGQLLTEDYYVFNKLARTLVGTNNIDSNSRLCMSSAVVGYKRTLGADAPPCSYEDLELADCVFVAGANPAAAHPVLFGRVLEARRTRGSQLVVVDPRPSETAQSADLHLALRPGTDLWLFTAMLGVMLRDGLIDEGFIARATSGFEAVARAARALPLAEAAHITGLASADIERAARLFARSRATVSLWCQGLNQSTHGADNTAALVHLHLASGQIGRPGAGPFSLTGQPNAMGGRETGTMATLLPGHRDPANADDRAQLAALWGVDHLPDRPGLPAIELFEACAQGKIQALWIACTNPAQSLPAQSRIRQALAAVPFLVVQDAFATETSVLADLVLPAATWGERNGTQTNSERSIALNVAAVKPPGEARPDWEIAAGFARALAARLAPTRAQEFDWPSAAAVFDEYKLLTAGRDLDISALSHERLAQGPVAWPFKEGAGTPRLYTEGRFATPDGKARFVSFELRGASDAGDAAFPLALTTVRLRDQWHGMSRSAQAPSLALPPARIELAPSTASELGIAAHDLVRIESEQGELVLPASLNPALAPGLTVASMHHGQAWLPTGLGINALGNPACDPLSRQPELKHSAVRLSRLDWSWHAALVMREIDDFAAAELRKIASELDWAALGRFPVAGGSGLVLLLAARHRPLELIESLKVLAGIGSQAPALIDPRHGRQRVLALESDRLVAVWIEAGSPSEIQAWSLYPKLFAQATEAGSPSLRQLFAPELSRHES